MSEEREFDNYVKNELSGFSPAVSPHIWENIIAERRKRKPVGFWANFLNTKNVLLVAGVFLLGASSLWFFNKNDKATASIENKNIGITSDKNLSSVVTNKIENNTPSDLSKQSVDADLGKEENLLFKKIDDERSVLRESLKHNFGATSFTNTDEKNNLVDDDLPENIGSGGINNGTLMNRLLFGMPATAPAVKEAAVLQSRKTANLTIPGCPTVEEEAAGDKRYFEVYIGPDFTLRNFKDTTAQSAYLQKRKASTKVSSAYSVGARYTKVFKNGVSIKAGLNYSQINEKFSFVQNNLVQVTYIIDPNTGDTTGSYTVTGTRVKTTYNKYRTLDIPFLMGYELGNGRLHVNINAGAMINLYSWQRGEVLDTNFLPVSITTGKSVSSPYQFKTNVGVGLIGGASVYYKLTNQLHVLAEPYFRYSLKPMSKESLTLQQKYNTIGMRFGVRFDLK